MTDTQVDFEHRQTAHCESGVTAGLLRHHGLELSEPMAFGLAGALTFAYIPLVEFGGLPLFAYRMPPKWILKGISKKLGIKMKYETFRSPEAGEKALDRHLAEGRVVGMQTSVYWLPFFPPDLRFHFNAHNLMVYGKQGDEYLISDPTLPEAVRTPVLLSIQARQPDRPDAGALRGALIDRSVRLSSAGEGLLIGGLGHLQAEEIDRFVGMLPAAVRAAAVAAPTEPGS